MAGQSPDEQLHGGDVNPGFGAGDRSLEILGQAAVSIEPSEGSFDDPSPWEELKTGRVGGAFDNLDGPLAEFGESVTQIGAVIDTVGEEMAQPGKQIMDRRNDKPGTIAILDICGVHLGSDQQTGSIGHNVALTPFDLLGRIVTPWPAALGGLDSSESGGPAGIIAGHSAGVFLLYQKGRDSRIFQA